MLALLWVALVARHHLARDWENRRGSKKGKEHEKERSITEGRWLQPLE